MSDLCKCELCGNSYKRLTYHLIKTHNITKEEYSKMYPNSKFLSDDEKAKMSDRMTRVNNEVLWSNPTYREFKSESTKAQWRNPEYRELKSEQVKLQHQTNEYFKNKISNTLSKLQKARWADPEWRAKTFSKRSENMTRRNLANWKIPEYRSWMLHNIFSRNGRRVEYNGSTYRSNWEVYFVKYLELNNIEFKYEYTHFNFEYEGKIHSYIPDFYLPQYDIFVEIHPVDYLDQYMITKLSSVPNIVLLTENELFEEEFSIEDYISNPKLTISKYLS